MRLFSISAAAARSGLTPHVIRIWERRYGAVHPQRSDGNRRLYSEQDVERLRLLRRVTESGQSIGQVATVPDDELRSFLIADLGAAEPSADTASDAEQDEMVAACMSSVRRLDQAALAATLTEATIGYGHIALIERLIVPLMEHIGESWSEGNLRVFHEHLTSAVVRTHLGRALQAVQPIGNAPQAVAATPPGQAHELGVLGAAVVAASQGWRVMYLGASLPAEEIAGAARAYGAHLVLLGITMPPEDARSRDEILRIVDVLGAGVAVIFGGAAARGTLAGAPLPVTVSIADDLADVREQTRVVRRTLAFPVTEGGDEPAATPAPATAHGDRQGVDDSAPPAQAPAPGPAAPD